MWISFCWEENCKFENQWWSVQIALVSTFVEGTFCLFFFFFVRKWLSGIVFLVSPRNPFGSPIYQKRSLGNIVCTMHIAQWNEFIQMHHLLVRQRCRLRRDTSWIFFSSFFLEPLAIPFDRLTHRLFVATHKWYNICRELYWPILIAHTNFLLSSQSVENGNLCECLRHLCSKSAVFG